MKKLTAGIFATILGLTAMGAADAAVTSKAYVDKAIKTVSATAEGLDGRLTAAEGKITTIEGEQTTQNNSIQANTAAIDAIEADYLKAADKTELQNGLALKADKTFVGELPNDTEATTVVGFVEEKTANIASDADVTALDGRLTAAEGKITTIEGEQTTQNNSIQANTAAIDAIEADYLKAADKTELQTQITANKTSIDNLDATYATEAEAKAFADAKDAAIAAADAKGAQGITDAAAAQADATQALTDAAAAQADATQALTDAAAAQGDATKALDALKDTSKMADGNYALTMKVENGVPQYGWEYIDRSFEEGEDASEGDKHPEHDETTTQG